MSQPDALSQTSTHGPITTEPVPTLTVILRARSTVDYGDSSACYASLIWTQALGQQIARAAQACQANGWEHVALPAPVGWHEGLPEAPDPEHPGPDWGALEAWADDEARPYHVLRHSPVEEALEESELPGMRGEKLIVTPDHWWVEAYNKHTDETFETDLVDMSEDPWATHFGLPWATLHDDAGRQIGRLRLDPVTLARLRASARLSLTLPLTDEIVLRAPAAAPDPAWAHATDVPHSVTVTRPFKPATADQTAIIRLWRFTRRIEIEGQEGAVTECSVRVFEETLARAAAQLSLVAA